jgi:hypothetical protein
MADTIYIESRSREVVEPRVRSVDVVEIGYSGGDIVWGKITGNLQDQTDLWKQIKKNRKLAKAAL